MAIAKKFGTFGGVFTPSILTILGVIMYMRLPMIVGEAGLFGALGIILVAHLISITTGLSVSSIATDKRVKEGGTYYIISRSLGLSIGGTLGLALFVGLSFSVSLYLIGFSESFLGYLNLPMDINHIRIAGSIILLLVTVITFISTSLAIKTQYLIMTAIVLSLLSVFFGHHSLTSASPNLVGFSSGVPLMVLFGIFFPAVTGFEAGVSMSGDLKDAKRSIPLGTISAISIGLVVYIGLVFFLSYTVDGKLLATDPQALFKIALVPQLVIAGIWGATLSSALGSILAAPRILQSTALDKITPHFFARGAGASKEPRNALLLTFLIAEAGILIGQLDVIARIVSIFFITTYGFLNLSAAFESLTSSDFRPSFRIPAWVSILGFLACFMVMIQLDFLAMVGAVIILGTLFLILKRRQLVLETGDAWSSVWATLIRTGLRRLNKSTLHTRNWRPNIILFCGQDNARPHLVELAKAFSGKLGMYSAFEMVVSKEPNLAKDRRYQSTTSPKGELLIQQHMCHDVYEGMNEVSRVYGFSGIEPNTILMGWSKNEKEREPFLRTIMNFEKSDYNTILLNYNQQKKYGNKQTVDVWWSGWGSNLAFSIFLLRHFTVVGNWKDAHIRLLVINNGLNDRSESLYKSLQQILYRYRINLEVRIIDNSIDGLPQQEIIGRESAATDLTIIGIPDKKFTRLDQTYDEVTELSKQLGTFLLINSSTQFESFDLGLEAKPLGEQRLLQQHKVELPELKPSKYAAISEAISGMDANGQKVLGSFFEMTFVPVFAELEKLTNELQAAVDAVILQLDRLKGVDEGYRRRKMLIKVKNDFYFRINRMYGTFAQSQLAVQRRALESGISWYLDRLDKDIGDIPPRMFISYERQDLAVKPNDPFLLRWFKLRRRMEHPFSGNVVPVKVRYREIADYYLRRGRHTFLSVFLAKLQTDILGQLSEGRALVMAVDTTLEGLFGKASRKDDLLNALEPAQVTLQDSVYAIMANVPLLQEQVYSGLMQELGSSLQSMSNDMEAADINYRIGQIGSRKRSHDELLQKVSGFAESWYEQTLYQTNKIHLDVILQSFRCRIKDKINELSLIFDQQLDQRFRLELKEVRAKLEKFGNTPDELPNIKISFRSFEENITLLSDFERFGDEIIKFTETLPQSITIASSTANTPDDEAREHLSIPLSKITRFYIESRFLGAAHDQLDEVAESLKNSFFFTQDLLSLTRFNLENIPDDLADKTKVVKAYVDDACQKILAEEEKVGLAKERITLLIDNSLREVFDQLSAYRISQTAQEYSRFMREQQGKEVRRKFGAFLQRMRFFFKHFTARVLYTRSEGILLAKKMMDAEPTSLSNQKILDLVETVSPKEKVLNMLPQFYKNLFSGQSLISEDFWISRETDEEMFRTGVRRHRLGYQGGILVVGERNSGKSAFCRHLTEKCFRREKVAHLYSTYSGSTQVTDFTAALRKATNAKGSINEIMESLPPGSVLVIHDLELWWERSLEGWEIVKLLINLINDYGKRCLFVVNINPYAFTLMDKMVQLQEQFVSVIPLRPFNSLELQEMIIRRHRSSGLKFVLRNREEDKLAEMRMASLFNKYFDFSEGNPGVTLKAWLVNILKISEKRIFIRAPQLPDTTFLTQMDEEWKVMLIQLILHKRMSLEKISRLFLFPDEAAARATIKNLLRAGLIVEGKDNVFTVNQFVEPLLVRIFRREGVL